MNPSILHSRLCFLHVVSLASVGVYRVDILYSDALFSGILRVIPCPSPSLGSGPPRDMACSVRASGVAPLAAGFPSASLPLSLFSPHLDHNLVGCWTFPPQPSRPPSPFPIPSIEPGYPFCMYVYIYGHTYIARVWIDRVMLPILPVVS